MLSPPPAGPSARGILKQGQVARGGMGSALGADCTSAVDVGDDSPAEQFAAALRHNFAQPVHSLVRCAAGRSRKGMALSATVCASVASARHQLEASARSQRVLAAPQLGAG
jgi:hypothetical protein